jgi:hypothetical protein
MLDAEIWRSRERWIRRSFLKVAVRALTELSVRANWSRLGWGRRERRTQDKIAVPVSIGQRCHKKGRHIIPQLRPTTRRHDNKGAKNKKMARERRGRIDVATPTD